MARIDMKGYRELVLKDVEACFLDNRDEFPEISSFGFYQALRSELLTVDPETGFLEVPDDYCATVERAATRIWDHMAMNHDLGFGAAH